MQENKGNNRGRSIRGISISKNIIPEEEVISIMQAMAKKVDLQNSQESKYIPMSNNYNDSIAFNAALKLVIEGASQPSGYTEPILHDMRIKLKSSKKNNV